METNFELLNSIKYLISTGKNFEQISGLLNLDLNYVKYLSKKIKTDIIQDCNSDEFYLIIMIDTLLGKKYHSYNRFSYELQYKVLEMLHLSDEEIVEKLNINIHRLLSFYKSMYFMLYVYDIEDVPKSYLPIIKDRIDRLNYVFDIHRYEYDINEYQGDVRVKFPDGRIRPRDIKYGKILDLGEEETFKFICIADPHFGAKYENLEYLERVYEYARNNGINYIVVLGDLIEGNCFDYSRCLPQYKSINSQVEHVLSDYCYDSNIKNIILLGNHDFSAYTKEGIDISGQLSTRKDFSIIGYKEAYIKIRDEYITLKHDVSKIVSCISNPCTQLNLIGHSHQYRVMYNDDSIMMKVPTLSDVYAGEEYVINKGFVVCEVKFDDFGMYYIDTEYIDLERDESIKFKRTF